MDDRRHEVMRLGKDAHSLEESGWINLFNAELSQNWRGPRSQEVPVETDYTYRYTVTARMTPALSRAAMRAILMFY